MANRRGHTFNDPIDLDEFPDNREHQSAPILPRARRPTRPSNLPLGVDVIALSDDEHGGGDDFEETAPLAWAAARTRRESNNRSIPADGGLSLSKRAHSPRTERISRSPSAKTTLPRRTSMLDDDKDLLDLDIGEPFLSNEPTQWYLIDSADSVPVHQPNVTSSKQRNAPELYYYGGAKPLPAALSIATHRSNPSSRQLSPEHSTTAATTAAPRQANEQLSSEVSSLGPSTSLSANNLVQNMPPTSAVEAPGAVTTVPPTRISAELNSTHTVLEPISLQAQDTPGSAAGGRQVSSMEQDRGFNLPIGEFADHDGEQTSSSRVNTLPAIERANPDHEAKIKTNETSSMSIETNKSQVPNLARIQPKQKAVKTVKRREDRGLGARSLTKQHSRDQVKDATPTNEHENNSIALQHRVANSEPGGSEASTRGSPSREMSGNSNGNVMADTTSGRSTLQFPFRTPMAPPLQKPHTKSPLSVGDTDRTLRTVPGPSNQPPDNKSEQDHQVLRAPTAQAVSKQSLAETVIPQSNTQTETERNLIIADDIITMRLVVEDCLRSILGYRRKAHVNLTAVRMKCQRTCQERELRAQRRQRKGPISPALPQSYVQSVSPFARMDPLQVTSSKKSNRRLRDVSQEVFTKAKPKDIMVRSTLTVSTSTYKSEAVCIPAFKEFVSLKDNILADNESKLLATPYFQDEDDDSREKLLKLLPHCYEMIHDEKGPLDLRIEQCRFYKESIEAFFCRIGITWNEVLFWLLAPEYLIKLINGDCAEATKFERLLLSRIDHEIEAFERDEKAKRVVLFERDSSMWQGFLSRLTQPTTKNLRLSAIACAAVFKECLFSIWYLAQQSETLLKHVSEKTKNPPVNSKFTYREAVCRVCHQHNCLIHGELREEPHDSWQSQSEPEADDSAISDSELSDDREDDLQGKSARHDSQLVNHDNKEEAEEEEAESLPAHFDKYDEVEKMINYKLLANPNAFGTYAESEMIESRGSKPPEGKFNSQWWLQHSYTHMWEKRKPFFPCNHEGSCDEAQCRCYRENINCEKTCKCSRLCKRRFPGCSCTSTPGKRTCALATCLCFKFKRECDADLCGPCGATEILDPVNRYDESLTEGRCCNVAIQRAVPKRTLLGHSEVHGFGLYMGEDIKKDEYIGEYLGETISVREGNRRLTIYEYQQTMYLFKLNAKQEVDATFMGNKMRFINNADRKFTNCYAKNLLCNTVFRLALYASTNIKAGTELYFDYNYPKETTQHFKQPKGKVVAVKDIVKSIKQKGKTKSFDTIKKPSTSTSVGQPSEALIEALKKARAEKAKKRATNKLGEQASLESTISRHRDPQQVRKTAHNNQPNRHQHPGAMQPRDRGVKIAQRSDSRHGSNASRTHTDADDSNHEATVSDQEVQDTDENDDVSDDTQEDIYEVPLSEHEELAMEDSESGNVGRTRSKSKKRPSMAPVVAVKKKVGGARAGAGRKRKRPVVFNSDDE